MQRRKGIQVAAALLAALIGTQTQAALQVDFNTSSSATQSGFAGVTKSGATGIVTDVGVVNVTPTVVKGSAFDDRDRGAVGGDGASLSDVLRDFIFTSIATGSVTPTNKPTIDVTITGLNAGHYKVATFLHDNNVVQGFFDISISNNGGTTYVLKNDNVEVSSTTMPSPIGTDTFDFYADGTHSVKLRVAYDSGGAVGAGNRIALINGFTMTPRTGLFVDFNDNDNEQSGQNDAGISFTQAGYISVTQNGATGIASAVTKLNTTTSISFNSISAGGNPDRDRGALNSAQAQSSLLRDFIFNQVSTFDITVTNIQAGDYEFTGYFHDNTANQGTVDVLVSTDGGSTFTNGVLGVAYSTGTNPAAVGMGRFYFHTDGTQNLVFRVDGSGTNNVINGFDLVLLPTPAALPAGLAMMGMLMMRRRS
ncbi:MAG: hypothetical protein GC162_05295 [Planctomycetes bacterium]|nr:hypothetical protein [Planctomycetota bacterium]